MDRRAAGRRSSRTSPGSRSRSADVLLSTSRGLQTLAETAAELGQRARAATPEEAARAGDRVVVGIPPAPYQGLFRRRTVGQGRARHRSIRDAPYDELDDGRVGLVEPRHLTGEHQQHALGDPGQRTNTAPLGSPS
ncbi:NAD(P)-binding domain-containing protein [Streptomyces canus]|uniref:NAD(P)-binding domain-containing protein n=1 Tax=Streptomyces canus TaxID=58343 RepID=UPI003F4D593A